MPDRDEIQRIAAAMNALRPDWRITSLVTFLTAHHATRPYRDLAIAAVSVATDPKTTTPNLLNEHGAWWVAAQTVRGETARSTAPAPGTPRCPEPGHEHELASNCRICISDRMAAMAPDGDAALTISPDQAARNVTGAAAVRASLHTTERTDDE
jgi:hypothetical protein